jgi:ABC-type Mn2+/Zn2+ transport system permease subunit
VDELDVLPWAERLSLFRFALLSALVAGVVCPMLGVFLHVRRTSFYGIALPQFATAGVVFGFVALPWWIEHVGLGGVDLAEATRDSHAVMNYHLAWSNVFTFGGLFALLALSRRGGSEVGRVAGAFAIAAAATLLFGRMSPVGKGFVDELIAGELLGVGVHEFETLAVLYGLAAALFVLYRRDFLLVSYDRESAQVLGKRVFAIEALLTAVTGLVISAGTMFLGPVILFGLIVLPAIGARAWARSMRSYFVLSSFFGVLAVALGVGASFEFDLPLGAAIAGAAALLLLPGFVARRG